MAARSPMKHGTDLLNYFGWWTALPYYQNCDAGGTTMVTWARRQVLVSLSDGWIVRRRLLLAGRGQEFPRYTFGARQPALLRYSLCQLKKCDNSVKGRNSHSLRNFTQQITQLRGLPAALR